MRITPDTTKPTREGTGRHSTDTAKRKAEKNFKVNRESLSCRTQLAMEWSVIVSEKERQWGAEDGEI